MNYTEQYFKTQMIGFYIIIALAIAWAIWFLITWLRTYIKKVRGNKNNGKSKKNRK